MLPAGTGAGAALEAWSRAPSGAGSGHGADRERRGGGPGHPPFSCRSSSPHLSPLSSPCRFQPGMLEELPLLLGLLGATQRGRAPRGRRSSVVVFSVFSSKCFFMLPKRDARLRVRHVGAGELGCCRCIQVLLSRVAAWHPEPSVPTHPGGFCSLGRVEGPSGQPHTTMSHPISELGLHHLCVPCVSPAMKLDMSMGLHSGPKLQKKCPLWQLPHPPKPDTAVGRFWCCLKQAQPACRAEGAEPVWEPVLGGNVCDPWREAGPRSAVRGHKGPPGRAGDDHSDGTVGCRRDVPCRALGASQGHDVLSVLPSPQVVLSASTLPCLLTPP